MAHTIGNCRASQSSLSQRTFRRRDCDRLWSQLMLLVRRLRRETMTDDDSWSRLSLLAAADRLGGRSSPSALARALDMHSSNTAAALRDAQARGYIFRSPDTVDRRRSWVILSDAGRKTLADARARRSDWLEQAIQREFTQDERDLLIRAGELLERLANVGDLK